MSGPRMLIRALAWFACLLAGALLLAIGEIGWGALRYTRSTRSSETATTNALPPRPASPPSRKGEMPPLLWERTLYEAMDERPLTDAGPSPAIGPDGTLYAGAQGHFVALRRDGTVRWEISSPVAGRFYPFVRDDGVVCALASSGWLSCYDENGQQIESVGGMAAGGLVSGAAALGHDNVVFVPGTSERRGSLWAFNIEHQLHQLWRNEASARAWFTPSVGVDETIYAGTGDNTLRAVGRDGILRWSISLESGSKAPPAIAPNGTLYVSGLNGQLQAFTPFGERLWSVKTGAPIRSPPVLGADGTVYVGSDDKKLYAINALGKERWSFITTGPVRSAPALARDGTIYFGSDDGHLYALAPNGTEKWRYATGGAVFSPTMFVDGSIFFESTDGKLRAIRDPFNGGLETKGWPKWARDLGNTGRAPRPSSSTP